MGREQPEYQPPLITHVPSQEDLVAANRAAEIVDGKPFVNATPRPLINDIFRGEGYDMPAKISPPHSELKFTRPAQSIPEHLDTPYEPYVAPEIERRISRLALHEMLKSKDSN